MPSNVTGQQGSSAHIHGATAPSHVFGCPEQTNLSNNCSVTVTPSASRSTENIGNASTRTPQI